MVYTYISNWQLLWQSTWCVNGVPNRVWVRDLYSCSHFSNLNNTLNLVYSPHQSAECPVSIHCMTSECNVVATIFICCGIILSCLLFRVSVHARLHCNTHILCGMRCMTVGWSPEFCSISLQPRCGSTWHTEKHTDWGHLNGVWE